MSDKLSRRKLLQAGAAGTIGAVAGCTEALPKEIQCRAGNPSTFTFIPATPLDEVEVEREDPDLPQNESEDGSEPEVSDAELNRNRVVDVLATRAHVAMKYEAIPKIKRVEVLDSGETSFEFEELITDSTNIRYILASNGDFELTVQDSDGNETSIFTATGEYLRRGARAEQMGGGNSDDSNSNESESGSNEETASTNSNTWVAGLPLGPNEASDLKDALREEGVADAPEEYTFNTYLYGEQISEAQLGEDGVNQLLSEEWDKVLPISGLSRRHATALVAHAQSPKPPVDFEVETSCRELEHHVDEFAPSGNESEGTQPSSDSEAPEENTTEEPEQEDSESTNESSDSDESTDTSE